MVRRLTADVHCEVLLGDDPFDFNPEAFDRAAAITIVDFDTFEVFLNVECDSSTSPTLPVFTKVPIIVHCDPPVV